MTIDPSSNPDQNTDSIVTEYLAVVEQKGKDGWWFKGPIDVLSIFSAFFIYGMVFPLVFLDICLNIYQAVYFTIHKIPKIDRSKYMVFDRIHLSRLNILQKINCVYCEYASGMIAWAKAVINQTEIYSCAIKHWHPSNSESTEHQKEFYEYERFK